MTLFSFGWIRLDVRRPIVFSNVLAVADNVIGDIRIASLQSVRVRTTHQEIHLLMNDACKILQSRGAVFLADCSQVMAACSIAFSRAAVTSALHLSISEFVFCEGDLTPTIVVFLRIGS